mgnify:CR=1 FL=1
MVGYAAIHLGTGGMEYRVLADGSMILMVSANTQDTAAIGETFSYTVTIPATPHTAPLYDVRILDDLSASAADLEFVSVAKIAGSGSWTPVNTGTPTDLVIEDPANGIDIPAGEQVTVAGHQQESGHGRDQAGHRQQHIPGVGWARCSSNHRCIATHVSVMAGVDEQQPDPGS